MTGSRRKTRAGEEFDEQKVRADIARIYGTDIFESVTFELARHEDSNEATLTIDADERSWGPHYLKVGIRIEDDFSTNTRYGFSVNYTLNPVNRLGAEWRNIFEVGSDQRVFSEFYQPLDSPMETRIASAIFIRGFTIESSMLVTTLADYRHWCGRSVRTNGCR